MADNIVINIDGFQGESVLPGYENWIILHGWSWGATQSGTTHEGMGSGGGKVHVQDITCTKLVDSSTHDLIRHVSKGTHVPKAQLVVMKADGDKAMPYFQLEIKNLIVTSYQTSGSKDGLDRVSETFTLNFEEFKVIYTKQNADGSPGPESDFSFNIPQNIEV